LTTVNRLGELERAIMDVLWATDTSLTVREVSARLTQRNLAHTTVMTEQTGDRTAALTRFAQSVSGPEADVLRDALEVIEGSGEKDDGT